MTTASVSCKLAIKNNTVLDTILITIILALLHKVYYTYTTHVIRVQYTVLLFY